MCSIFSIKTGYGKTQAKIFGKTEGSVYLYFMRHRSYHHTRGETIRVLVNGILKLTLKHYKMQTISINVDDNQADLDALKQQAQSASEALTAAITQLETVSAALTAFQITFTASEAPSA